MQEKRGIFDDNEFSGQNLRREFFLRMRHRILEVYFLADLKWNAPFSYQLGKNTFKWEVADFWEQSKHHSNECVTWELKTILLKRNPPENSRPVELSLRIYQTFSAQSLLRFEEEYAPKHCFVVAKSFFQKHQSVLSEKTERVASHFECDFSHKVVRKRT